MKKFNNTMIALVALELTFVIAIIYGAFTYNPAFYIGGAIMLAITWIAGITYLKRKGWVG